MTSSYDSYLGRIIEQEDRVLFEEAITCARASALRAAYVLTWLSAAESLKRKFKQLAPQDSAAARILGDVETKEANKQAVDAFLLSKAQEYGLISVSDKTRLEHVYTMRCMFGHPYEEYPTEEAVRAAMADVLDTVLAKPTKLRHRFINDQITLLTTRPSFLDDGEAAVGRHARAVFPKVAEDLHAYFVDKLLKRLTAIYADASMGLFLRRGLWFLKAYLRVDPEATLELWDVSSAIIRDPVTASLVLAHRDFWPLLLDNARSMIVGELLQEARASAECFRILQALHETGSMNKRENERFVEALKQTPAADLAAAGIPLTYFVEDIIIKLKSHNWPTQNPTIQILRDLGPTPISQLSRGLQHKLGNNVLQAADGGAYVAINFLKAIGSDSQPWHREFVAGVVEECFVNDEDRVRFKHKQLPLALSCLCSLQMTLANAVVRRVAKRINSGDAEQLRDTSERSMVLRTLEEAADALPAGVDLGPLKDAIEALDIAEDNDA